MLRLGLKVGELVLAQGLDAAVQRRRLAVDREELLGLIGTLVAPGPKYLDRHLPVCVHNGVAAKSGSQQVAECLGRLGLEGLVDVVAVQRTRVVDLALELEFLHQVVERLLERCSFTTP